MMIGMGTPISQSSAPLPNPMSMSSVWPAPAPAHAQTFVGQKRSVRRSQQDFRRRKPPPPTFLAKTKPCIQIIKTKAVEPSEKMPSAYPKPKQKIRVCDTATVLHRSRTQRGLMCTPYD